jgi:hypothetical protein
MHQVDVLGQLEWIPAFTFPLRLFVEAKFRRGRTGLPVVRNAVGVLVDVNGKYGAVDFRQRLQPRYRYAYGLFSTSGFSIPAVDMAFAHEISLVDLSGGDFNDVRDSIIVTAQSLVDDLASLRRANEPGAVIGMPEVSAIRSALRLALGTQPEGVPSIEETQSEFQRSIGSLIEPLVNVATHFGELFVAMADGPFLLILKAQNRFAFLGYAEANPTHRVTIRWNPALDDGRTWEIRPSDDQNAYRLTFRLPDQIARYIFSEGASARARAWSVKQRFFSSIAVYHRVNRNDRIFRLEFDIDATSAAVEQLRNQT